MPPPIQRYGVLRKARPINSERHLKRLLEEYLPRTSPRGPDQDSVKLFGYAAHLVDVRTALKNEGPPALTRWWLASMAARKEKAFHLVFALPPVVNALAEANDALVGDELLLAASGSLECFRRLYYGDDPFTYLGGFHNDTAHPHAHFLLHPYTYSGQRISVSPSYQATSEDATGRRNNQAALRHSFNVQAKDLYERWNAPTPLRSDAKIDAGRRRVAMLLSEFVEVRNGKVESVSPDRAQARVDEKHEVLADDLARVDARNSQRRANSYYGVSEVVSALDGLQRHVAELSDNGPPSSEVDRSYFTRSELSDADTHEERIEKLLNERESCRDLAAMFHRRRQTRRMRRDRLHCVLGFADEVMSHPSGVLPAYEVHQPKHGPTPSFGPWVGETLGRQRMNQKHVLQEIERAAIDENPVASSSSGLQSEIQDLAAAQRFDTRRIAQLGAQEELAPLSSSTLEEMLQSPHVTPDHLELFGL